MNMAPNKPLAVLVDGARFPHDGQLDWPLDRGLHYGDGLFETMMVRDGRIRFASLHRARLTAGCARLRLALALEPLWEQTGTLARQHGDAVLKLLVTRGSATQRGYGISGDEQCRSLLFAYPPADSVNPPADVCVVSLRAQLGENPALAGIKHCNRLEQVLARLELQPSGAYEGLLGSSSGWLISGTMSNVFLDTAAGLVTPSLERCGIAGVMRAVVLREAAALGIPVRVANVALAALDDCHGLFLTNVRLGVLPVTRLDGRALATSRSRARPGRQGGESWKLIHEDARPDWIDARRAGSSRGTGVAVRMDRHAARRQPARQCRDHAGLRSGEGRAAALDTAIPGTEAADRQRPQPGAVPALLPARHPLHRRGDQGRALSHRARAIAAVDPAAADRGAAWCWSR